MFEKLILGADISGALFPGLKQLECTANYSSPSTKSEGRKTGAVPTRP
jgi:hypothetical protein